MPQKPGTWTFLNKVNGQRTTMKLTDTSPSTIKKAFDAAYIALSGSNSNLFFGYDISGREFRYSSASMGKKFDR